MDSAEAEPVESETEEGPYRAGIGSVAFAVLCLALAMGATLEAISFPGEAGLAPLTVGLPTAALLLLAVIHEIRHFRHVRTRRPLVANPYMWIALYALAFYALGAIGALVVFSLTLIRWRGDGSWKAAIIATATTAIGFFIITETLLGESLYQGLLIERLL